MTKRPRAADGPRCPECGQTIKPEPKKVARNIPAAAYVAEWRELLASGCDDLAPRWKLERDLRDKLRVPIADRVELLKSIEAVSEVNNAQA